MAMVMVTPPSSSFPHLLLPPHIPPSLLPPFILRLRPPHRPRGRAPPLQRAHASQHAGDDTKDSKKDPLATEFMQYVCATQQTWPLDGRRPTALMAPSTVIKVQMDALMRNDWPEDDSGVKTAFAFSMPARAEEMRAGQVSRSVPCARAWDAAERYLAFNDFAAMLRDPLYAPIVNCSNWEVASPLMLHGPGDCRALQAVRITFQTVEGAETSRVYTFCLQKVQKGTYTDCWMVVGMRVGDYANV